MASISKSYLRCYSIFGHTSLSGNTLSGRHITLQEESNPSLRLRPAKRNTVGHSVVVTFSGVVSLRSCPATINKKQNNMGIAFNGSMSDIDCRIYMPCYEKKWPNPLIQRGQEIQCLVSTSDTILKSVTLLNHLWEFGDFSTKYFNNHGSYIKKNVYCKFQNIFTSMASFYIRFLFDNPR